MKITITRIAVCIFFMLTCFVLTGSAQPGVGLPYSFSRTFGSTVPVIINPAYVAAFAPSNQDDSISKTILPIIGTGPNKTYTGFPFGGVVYPSFCVSTNGFVLLTTSAVGNVAPPIAGTGLPTNGLASNATGLPIIAPLWDDLKSTPTYRWDTAAKVLWVRWTVVSLDKSAAGTTFTFAVALYAVGSASPGTISIDLYFTTAYTYGATTSPSIGISGPCTGDFWSVRGTGAAADSSVENILSGVAVLDTAVKNKTYIFTPKNNIYDNCLQAKLLYSSPVSSACFYDTLSTVFATTSGSAISCSPGGMDVKDVWVKFVKPSGISGFNFNTVAAACQPLAGTSIEIFTGSCAALAPNTCTTNNAGTSVSGLSACTSDTIFARITADGDAVGKFKVCVQNPTIGYTCANPKQICTLNYTDAGQTTTGSGNEYTAGNTPCASAFHGGNDYVYTYTPPANECDSIYINGITAGLYPGVFVYDGCPTTVGTKCIASSFGVTGASTSASIRKVNLKAGTTYYIIIDNNSTSAGGTANMAFNFYMFNNGTAPANDECASVVATGPYDFGDILTATGCAAHTKSGTTECASPSTLGFDPACAGFVNGLSNDVWYMFTSQISGPVQINLTQGSTNPILNAGLAVYAVNCSGLIVDCQGTGTSLSSTINTAVGDVFYIRVWTTNAGQEGSFNLCVFDPSGAVCSNASIIPGFNYNSPTINTSGYGDDYTSANTPCASPYHSGQDFVFKYTTGASAQCVQIYINGTGLNSYPGVFLYNGCPDAGGTNCVAFATGISNLANIAKVTLAASTTYYIVADNNAGLGPASISFALHILTQIPPSNDDCAGAVDFTTINGGASCAATTRAGNNDCSSPSTGSAVPACGGFTANYSGDVWYKFTSGITGALQINLTPGSGTAIANAGMAIYTSSCAGTIADCQGPGSTLTSSLAVVTGVTYYIRIWSPPGSTGSFNLCVFDNSGGTCATAVTITTLPYSAGPSNTSGFGNEYTAANTPCASAWHNGPDYVFKYTSPTTQCVQISLTGTGANSYPGVFLYDACPDVAIHCVASATGTLSTSTTALINRVSLTAGTTYYIIVDNNSVLGSASIPFSISVTSVGGPPANDNRCGAVSLGTIDIAGLCSTHSATGTTECASYSAENLTPSCAGFVSGVTGDVWYSFVAGSTATAAITLSPNGATPILNAGIAIYVNGGNCLSSLANVGAGICIGPGSALSVPNISLISGFTYWVRIWSPNPSDAGGFKVCVSDNCYANDEPCGAIVHPTPTTTCTPVTYSTSCSTFGSGYPTGSCPFATSNRDSWFQVTIPASGSYVFTLGRITPGMTDPVIQLYQSPTNSCSNLTTLGCVDDNGVAPNFLFSNMIQNGLVAGQTVWIRVWAWNASATGQFTMCIYQICQSGVPSPFGDDPCTVPVTSPVLAACTFTTFDTRCATNTASAGNAPCTFPTGQSDVWMRFIVPPSGQFDINVQRGTILDWALEVFRPTGGACGQVILANMVACNDDYAGSLLPYIFLSGPTVLPGDTLYVRIFTYSSFATGTGSICLHDPCPSASPPVNDDPCFAIDIPVNATCVYSGPYTNLCAGISTGVFPAPGCVPGVPGPYHDVWFKVRVPASGRLDLDILGGTMPDAVLTVYGGGSLPTSCGNITTKIQCDDNGSPNPQMPHASINWTAFDTVYVRVWDKGGLGAGSFSICATDPCPGGSNPNDLPCNAILLSTNVYTTANNSCAGNTGEPFVYPIATPNYNPSCWTNTNSTYFNTVWYSFVAPSTSVTIRTLTGSLTNTQIALFSGTCNAPAIVPGACNDDQGNCGGGLRGSQITATVAPGQTYYVVVDGYQALTGTFTIVVQDATVTNPPQPVQDCVLPASICNEVTNVPAPGYPGYGSICDLPAGAFGCFPAYGEGNSSFYTFTIDTAGTLFFDITPTSNGTNYDWILWRVGTTANPVSSMTNVCSLLSTHTTGAGGLPQIAGCNISSVAPQGATGISATGTGTSNTTLGPAYNQPLPVVGGETYLLMINNTQGTNVGYTLDFTSLSPLNYGSPTSVAWTTPSNASFVNPANWGCGSVIPSCQISASIRQPQNYPTSSWVQPQVTTANLSHVNDLTIDAGASLSIGNNDTLFVCGNFTNNGRLICSVNSVVDFVGIGTQVVSGNFTGINKFAHVLVNKVSGVVTLGSDIDVGGKFTIANNVSVFNINGKYMKVGGHFKNVSGKNTFIGRGRSTVEFNGSANQILSNGTDSTLFDRVVVNKTGGDIYLSGAFSSLYADSSLTLTKGKIFADSVSTLEVAILKNNLPWSLIGGNSTSYVIGKLRRFVSAPGNLMQSDLSFDYPVGDATNYENANIYWYYSNQFGYVTGYYTPWPPVPPVPVGPAALECLFATYDTYPLLDNGYWTFLRSNPAQVGGKYVVTLNNTGYTNDFGPAGAKTVVMCDTAVNPYAIAAWYLKGRCVYASTTTNVQRDSINSAAYGGPNIGINYRFATGQFGTSPFPIELLYFIANPEKDGVQCSWETASEINNDYFKVERSTDGIEFKEITDKINGFGQGSSTQPRFYGYFDKQPPCLEVIYYRLKQVDIDGSVTYSDVVAVNCNNKDMISLYPNPATTQMNLNFYQSTKGKVLVTFVDMVGKVVFEKEYDVQSGYNAIKLDIGDLAQGAYYMKLSDFADETNFTRQAKFLKY